MPQRKRAPRKVELDQACVIREEDQEYCIYPMGDLMAVLGKRWSLFIIAVLGNERRMRFNDLARQLKGISPRTLTDGLRELESLGLVERTLFPEVPPRVEYTITSEGRDLRRTLIPVLRWAIDFEAQGSLRTSA